MTPPPPSYDRCELLFGAARAPVAQLRGCGCTPTPPSMMTTQALPSQSAAVLRLVLPIHPPALDSAYEEERCRGASAYSRRRWVVNCPLPCKRAHAQAPTRVPHQLVSARTNGFNHSCCTRGNVHSGKQARPERLEACNDTKSAFLRRRVSFSSTAGG